jgi:NADP-dependent 3-hydroxy acid dehydrogenase YdfG
MRVDHNTVAVVTGASGGVGRATARLLGERGARVVLIARGRDGLAGAKREVEQRGGRALVVAADVSRFDEVQAAADAAQRAFGRIELWINNAMVSMYSPFMRMDPEEFRHIVDVTFLGTVHGTRVALERMLAADRGVIIQVGSALAFRSIPLQSAYCASRVPASTDGQGDAAVVAYAISRSTRSAAVTPRNCASSNRERPLMSECAKTRRSRDRFSACRSAEKTAPTIGRTIAWPIRITSRRDTHALMRGCTRSRSVRIASFQ